MIKNFVKFILVFVSVLFISILINYIFYKKYKISFVVITDNLPMVETIAFDQKNIKNPLYSSIRYKRIQQAKMEIFIKTNELDKSLLLIKQLRNDFLIMNYKSFIASLSISQKYFERKENISLLEEYLNFTKFLERNSTTVMQQFEFKDDQVIGLQKNIIDKKDKFTKFLINQGFEEKISKDIALHTIFIAKYLTNFAVEEIDIKIIREKLIDTKELLIILLFSILSSIFLFYTRKIKS